MKKLSVSVVGCSLADSLYSSADFTSPEFHAYASKKDGDGGLQTGKLIFADALEHFAGEPYPSILKKLTGGKAPAGRNLGGPAVVGAINAAQILEEKPVSFSFYGCTGKDATADFIRSIIAKTPLKSDAYIALDGASPSTDVLSDPRANNGKGERTFINTIGAGYDYTPDHLDDAFFSADVVWFGATALVPPIHNNLSKLLKRAKDNGAVTVVSTVFDFINEQKHPDQPWPMGDGAESYKYIDLLVIDWDEAVRLSGKDSLDPIVNFFRNAGVSALVITHGAKDFFIWSDGRLFEKSECRAWPVSALVDEDLAAHPEQRGDTTGCGDNFAGGFISSAIAQLAEKEKGSFDLADAAAWAASSGGFACFCLGGTYLEKAPGEKLSRLQRYHDAYLKQIGK